MIQIEVTGKTRKEVIERIRQRIEKCYKILHKIETPEHYKEMTIFERETYRAIYISEIQELEEFIRLFDDKERTK